MNSRGIVGITLLLALIGLTACTAEPAPPAPGETGAARGGEQGGGRAEAVGVGARLGGRTPGDPGYRAGGNEPFWDLTFGEGSVDFHRLAADSFTLSVPAAQAVPGGWRITTTANGAPFVIDVRDAKCNDTMSGRPFPHTVTVAVGGETLHGCGGDTESLLAGEEWVVTNLEGAGTGGANRPTLHFMPGGELTGTGGCNRFRSDFELTGEGLTFSPPVATRMACAEPRGNEQETRFFELLEQVTRFDIAADGTLELYALDRVVIEARR